jgi:NodT family efflux transporter outer membrane factor (OMF) lipoprotein
MKKTAILTVLLATSFLTACSQVPTYERPGVDTPAAFAGQAQGASETPINADWWTNFGSSELNTLMDQALEQNNDLRAGLYRIEQARASLRVARSDLYPSISASAGANRNFSRGGNTANRADTSLSAGIDVGYELDLFGRVGANVQSSNASLRATQFDVDALHLIVMGDVANGYFTLVNLRERLAIADENLANAREVQRIVKARFDAGSVSQLDLSQQNAQVATREASRATLAAQMAQAQNALAVLVGQTPESISVQGQKLKGMNVPKIVAGQPSSLLERRPDIRASEAALVAANAYIGVARAAMFPSVTLGTGWSVAAASFSNPATTALQLAASVAAPLFQGGRIEAGIEQATARQKELAENYRKTVLVSFQEVEDAMVALKAAHIRETALSTALTEARKAYSLSRQQYEAGAIDFQSVLTTQDALLSAQDSYAQTKLEALSASISLYKALGGGWE